MDSRAFNSLSHRYQELAVGKVLEMSLNPNSGPDLIDKDKVVEVKSRLVHSTRHYGKGWTPQDFQLNYENGRQAFWALQFYSLDREIGEIRIKEIPLIESMVTNRTIYIVKWDWMKQFPPSETSGKTPISEWKNIFRYPKYTLMPRVMETYEIKKGLVHITEGVPIELFKVAGKKIEIQSS